jgi:hypothetical protein
MLDQSPCGRTRLTLLRVGFDTYVALEKPAGPYAMDVAMQPWLGGRWASPTRLRLRFDHALRITRLRCADDNCARYEKAVSRIARRYDMNPQGQGFAAPRIRPGERKHADRLMRLAHAGRNSTLATLPFAHGRDAADLCEAASVFLWRVDGRLLVGRIGHGYRGWQRSHGWRIALWGLKHGKLVPVASAAVARPRGALLAMAAMPPEVVATR